MSLRNRLLRWLPAAAWSALLLYLGTRAPGALPSPGAGLDKIAHACFYGVLGLLAAHGGGRLLPAIALAALVGGLDEWLQSGVGRDADLLDWAADVAGAAAGAFLYLRTPWAGRRSRN
jgi:VanZ family protein